MDKGTKSLFIQSGHYPQTKLFTQHYFTLMDRPFVIGHKIVLIINVFSVDLFYLIFDCYAMHFIKCLLIDKSR